MTQFMRERHPSHSHPDRNSALEENLTKINASRVDNYLTMRKIFDRYSKEIRIQTQSQKLRRKKRKEFEKNVSNHFEEAFFNEGDERVLENLKNTMEDMDLLKQIYQIANTEIKQKTDEIEKRAPILSQRESIIIALKAAFAIPSLSHDQRKRLFQSAGYTEDETAFILKKIGIAAGVGTTLGTISEWITGAAIGISAFSPVANDISDPKTIGLLAASYGLYLSGIAINAEQNVRLLQNEKTKTCTSFLGTSLFYLLNKLTPSSTRDWTVRIGSVATDILRQARTSPLILTPFGPSSIITSNITMGVKQAIQAGAVASWLITHKTSKV